jgi:DNA-binding IclR family transcriptional regulator
VILASAGTPRPHGINIQPGQRLPLVPPRGTVFVAWADRETIDHWLGQVGPEVTNGDLARYRQALEIVRERGYSVGLGGEGQQRLVEALAEAGHGPDPGSGEYALIELAEAPTYRINHIGAPVFGPDGEVVLALFLIGFRGQIPAEEVPRYADRLRDAAERVSAAISGGAGLG